MKKKLLLGIFTVIMCFFITGCGATENDTPTDDNNNIQEGNIESYDITSTENKLVFTDPSGASYITYYFENDKIVKAEAVAKYPTVELAQLAYQTAKDQDPDVEVSVKGTYLIVSAEIGEYESLSKSELESALTMAGYKINK